MSDIVEMVCYCVTIFCIAFIGWMLFTHGFQMTQYQFLLCALFACIGGITGTEWIDRSRKQDQPSGVVQAGMADGLVMPGDERQSVSTERTIKSRDIEIHNPSEMIYQTEDTKFDWRTYAKQAVNVASSNGAFNSMLFEASPELPQRMNDEAELLDSLFDTRYKMGFYFNMRASVATPDFWMLQLAPTRWKENSGLKHSPKAVKAIIDELKFHVNTERAKDGILPEYSEDEEDSGVSIALHSNSLLYLQVSRPDRQTVTLTQIINDLEVEPETLFFGMAYVGVRLVPVKLNLKHPEQWSCGVVASSGSGKSVALKVALIVMMLNTSPDDTDIYLCEHAPKRELEHFQKAAHVKGYVTTKDGYHKLLDELEEHFRLVSSGDRKQTRVLLVSDEHPSFMADEDLQDRVEMFSRLYRSFGFSLLLLSQSGRADVLPGDTRTNITAWLVGKNGDGNTLKENLGVDFDVTQLIGGGDFLARIQGKERRFKTPFIDVDNGEDLEWIKKVVEKWGEPEQIIEYNQEPEAEPEIERDWRHDYVDNLLPEIDDIWDWDEMKFIYGMKGRAIELATGSRKTNNSKYGKKIEKAIKFCLASGYIQIEPGARE